VRTTLSGFYTSTSKMGTLKVWGADVIRIVCISDTHSMEMRGHISVPEGDVLIHAGDFSSTGRLEECQSFRNWMNSLPHKQKIIIAGNHDITMQKDYYAQHGAKMFHPRFFSNASFDVNEYATRSRDIVATGSTGYTYLEDSECKLVDPNTTTETALSVYGSPWQPEFYDWAYNLPRGVALKEKWDMIPTATDVLITHGPPHGILDKAADGVLCGCRELLTAVKTRVKPRLHIFGHIHEGYGKQMCYLHSARFSAVYCWRACVACKYSTSDQDRYPAPCPRCRLLTAAFLLCRHALRWHHALREPHHVHPALPPYQPAHRD
jgi:Icc-related predicted phosphoesterase